MCTTGDSPRRTSAAFTLVEIIVVITIISVMLTMTTISLSGAIGGVAARESAGNLLSALRYAHEYAALHGCQCRVTFSRAQNSYELTRASASAKGEFERLLGTSHAKLPDRVHFLSLQIPPIDDGESADVITFQPTGESNGASIVLSDGRDNYTLTVAASSGITRLKRGSVGEAINDREDLDAS